jgi:hypothetical protein
MCNDWYVEQRGAFDAWVREIKRGSPGGADDVASSSDNWSDAARANCRLQRAQGVGTAGPLWGVKGRGRPRSGSG